MSTNLEKYLRENRSRLDIENPDDGRIWSEIQNSNPRKINVERGTLIAWFSMSSFWKIAAIITIVLSLSYLTFDVATRASGSKNVSVSSINHDLLELENNYIQRVKYKQREIKSIDIPENDLINTLLDDLNQQDKLYKEAIGDLEELGNDQQVINTIFSIYERKIDLLERIIIETNKTENHEKSIETGI